MKPSIRLDFTDFFPGFVKTNNYFYRLLSPYYNLIICDQPDFLIYSPFGHQHKLHTCVKIFFTGESMLPNYDECDYSFTCRSIDDPRHCRVPFYATYGEPESIIKARDNLEQILAQKTKFCSFIVSNHNPRKNKNRLQFFLRLSQYKKVDSGGRFMNNIGGPIPNWSVGKVEYLRSYKFNIAFENASIPGYTTEKIFEAMQARCLPIYWGNPFVHEEFNPRSFLNYFDFPSEDALIEKIISLDCNDDQYLDYVRQPYFHNDTPNEYFTSDKLLRQFEGIFSTKISPVAQRRRFFSLGRWTLAKKFKPPQRE